LTAVNLATEPVNTSIPTIALVREPSDALMRCELTHLGRVAIQMALARTQHERYAGALSELGLKIEWLPPLPQHPDAVFVEDMAVILPEVAVIARSGAESRRGEAASVAEALSAYRPLRSISAPGCLDGGDVLLIGKTLFVGSSGRTNPEGFVTLENAVSEFGYRVRAVHVADCLHLKSACSFIPPDIVVANPRNVAQDTFAGPRVIAVDPREPTAANTLTLDGITLVHATCPFTEEKLRRAGVKTRSIDVSELQKAEAGLTCLSLIVDAVRDL